MSRAGVVLISLLAVAPALAHPVPGENHDRTIVVYLTPGALLVDFRLEVDPNRAKDDFGEFGLKGKGDQDWQTLYLNGMQPILKDGLNAKLDGKALSFECIRKHSERTDHLRCDYRFRAPWRLDADSPNRLTLYEGNFPDRSFNAIRWGLLSSPQVTVGGEQVPGEDPLLSDRVRRTLQVDVRAVPSVETGVVRPGLPPDPDPYRPGAKGRARRTAGVGKPGPGFPVAFARTSGPDDPKSELRYLDQLLDSKRGLLMLLLIAGAFGAAHALTPGHGKTLVAAYLVGERGTVGHAVLLGVVTTLTHTSSVLVLAAVLPLFFPKPPAARTQAVLEFVGGILIAGLGLWLLMQRLAGRADHVHLGGEGSEKSAPTLGGLIVLGVSGGLVPCWDAIVMLGVAVSTRRIWLGLPLLLAFSAGLASVLVALGVVVVQTRQAVESRFGRADRFRLLWRVLPVLGALVVTALGLWLCFSSVRPGDPVSPG